MRLKPNYRLLFFAGLFIFLLIGAMCARTALASHHKAQIAFTSTRDGNLEIYVMDADGNNQIRLTTHPEADYHNVLTVKELHTRLPNTLALSSDSKST